MEKVVIKYQSFDNSDSGGINNLFGRWEADIHLTDRHPKHTKVFENLKDAGQWMEKQGYKAVGGPEPPYYMSFDLDNLRASLENVKSFEFTTNKYRVIALLEERLAELEAEEKQKETHHV